MKAKLEFTQRETWLIHALVRWKREYVHINSMIGSIQLGSARHGPAWFGLFWCRYESMCFLYVEYIDLFLSIQHNGRTYIHWWRAAKLTLIIFVGFLLCVTWAHKMWCVTLNKLTIWCIAHRMLIASSIKPNVALCRILCTHEKWRVERRKKQKNICRTN